ncbi:hypothetical protein RhiirB3_450885 [Rhizophagus irregularis]|nr:hypothetical protein RhiirB3_450885 [Rhizophagus irregularis]
MVEENFDKISEPERISLKFNELLENINDDTDNTSTFSDIDFEELEYLEEEIKEQEICDEMDEIIEHLEQQNFTPCVIIDFIEGKFQQCKRTGKLKQLRNLFGTCKTLPILTELAIKEVNGVLSKLGVCDSHFQFDNKYLHQSISIGCIIHSWYLNKKNIQVPCIGQYKCEALQLYSNLCIRTYENIKRSQSICCLCYENLGGHIYHHSGIRGNLLIKIAQTGNNEIKKNILIKTFEILLPLTSNEIYTDSTTTILIPTTNISINYEQEKIILNKPSSLFMIKLLFIKIFKEKEIKKDEIKSLKTIQEYYNAFPKFLNDFFSGMIDELYQKKMKICNIKRKKRHKLPKIIIPEETIKIITVCHVSSHTNQYERQLAKIRMNETDPSKCLIKGKNIWNLAIIDNINFKEKTFKFVKTGPEQIIELTAETSLFGMNQGIENALTIFQQIIQELLKFKKINEEFTYNTNFNAETIKHKILNRLDYGSCGESPNIVILEPGSNPNSDDEILHVAEMYKKDFAIEDHSFLDIVANEAIFCRLASCLSIRFLDKFESAIDYRSTARVLDLIWVAVGVAINIYITKKEILFSEIMNDEENNHICLKLISVGNFRLQQDSLSAAGPLYASATKSNYTMAIVHFLATIAAHLQLEEKLNYYSAFKIPHDIDSGLHHICFGFDEALEIFGVRFIKGNISGNVIDEKNLKNQIKVSQSERERIDLLMSEYLNDNSISHSERAIKSRQESLWELVDDLKYPPTEMNQEGLDYLIACYPNGLKRIKGIYRQEVLKIESRNTKGRRAVGVVRTKVKDYNSNKKQFTTGSLQSSQKNTDENLDQPAPDTTKPQKKH